MFCSTVEASYKVLGYGYMLTELRGSDGKTPSSSEVIPGKPREMSLEGCEDD